MNEIRMRKLTNDPESYQSTVRNGEGGEYLGRREQGKEEYRLLFNRLAQISKFY